VFAVAWWVGFLFFFTPVFSSSCCVGALRFCWVARVTFRLSLAGRALAPSPRPFGESLQYSQFSSSCCVGALGFLLGCLVTFRQSLAGRALAPSPRPFGESLQYSQTGEQKELGPKGPQTAFRSFSPFAPCFELAAQSVREPTQPSSGERLVWCEHAAIRATVRVVSRLREQRERNYQQATDGESFSNNPSIPLAAWCGVCLADA
jgi:hypothetical protein